MLESCSDSKSASDELRIMEKFDKLLQRIDDIDDRLRRTKYTAGVDTLSGAHGVTVSVHMANRAHGKTELPDNQLGKLMNTHEELASLRQDVENLDTRTRLLSQNDEIARIETNQMKNIIDGIINDTVQWKNEKTIELNILYQVVRDVQSENSALQKQLASLKQELASFRNEQATILSTNRKANINSDKSQMVLNKINHSVRMLKSQVKNMHKTCPIVTGLSIYDLSGTTAFSNPKMRDHAAYPKRTKRKSPLSREKTRGKGRAQQHKGSALRKAPWQDGVSYTGKKTN